MEKETVVKEFSFINKQFCEKLGSSTRQINNVGSEKEGPLEENCNEEYYCDEHFLRIYYGKTFIIGEKCYGRERDAYEKELAMWNKTIC